jgi:hypothetical protein
VPAPIGDDTTAVPVADTTDAVSVTTADATPITKGVDAVVHIVIDHGTIMRGGTAHGEVCEIPGVGPVDVNWVKELLGSAFLTAVMKNGKDIHTVAHLGRHVPAEVMTALLVRGRECDIEGCNNRGYLERDHIHDHAQGGPTSSRTSAGSAPSTTASNRTAGNSARATRQPANALRTRRRDQSR